MPGGIHLEKADRQSDRQANRQTGSLSASRSASCLSVSVLPLGLCLPTSMGSSCEWQQQRAPWRGEEGATCLCLFAPWPILFCLPVSLSVCASPCQPACLLSVALSSHLAPRSRACHREASLRDFFWQQHNSNDPSVAKMVAELAIVVSEDSECLSSLKDVRRGRTRSRLVD